MGPMQALCMRATVQCLYEACRSLPFNQNITQEDHGLINTVHVIIVIHIKKSFYYKTKRIKTNKNILQRG